MTAAVHHIELWTDDLAETAPSFEWLLGRLGWRPRSVAGWDRGRIWEHWSGTYLVLEQSPDVTAGHDRLRGGLNHLALTLGGLRADLDRLRAEAPRHGWSELFADRYPHAGGPEHAALFVENARGFEVEIVWVGPPGPV